MTKEIAKKPVETARGISHSWTKISDYSTCPAMYKMKHLEKMPQEANPLMLVGRVTHNAINIYNKHCLKNRVEHDFEMWKPSAYLALEQENLPSENYAEVLEMVKNYADSHTVPLESTLGSEEMVAVTRDYKECAWDSPDAWFRIVADLLQIAGDMGKITDYKAGWLLTAPKFQLQIYACILSKIYPQVSVWDVEWDFTRHEYQTGFRIEQEELEDIEKMILTKTNRIEKEVKFKCQVGIACSMCSFWHWCPAMKQGREVMFKMPKTLAEANKLASDLEIYTRWKEESQKLLKQYCDEQGEIITGGRKFGFNVSNKWEIADVSELIVRAEEIGMDIFDVLTVHNTKLKRHMDNPKFVELLKDIGRKKVVVSFSSKKYKAENDLAPEDDKEEKSK